MEIYSVYGNCYVYTYVLYYLLSNVLGILFYENKSNSCLMYFLLLSFIIGTLYPFGQVIKAYVPFLDETSRIATYANWDQFNNEIGILTNFTTLKQIILCVLCYIYWTRLKEVISCFSVLYLAYVLSTCWLMLFNDFCDNRGTYGNFSFCRRTHFFCRIFMLIQ